MSFAQFKDFYGRVYAADSAEHRRREEIFHQRLAEIEAHNARGRSWKMGVNHLTDWTHEELQVLNGHKPSLRARPVESDSLLELGREEEEEEDEKSCASNQLSCAESPCCSGLTCGTEGVCVSTKTAESFDWGDELSTAQHVLDQGSCGSCWAVAAAGALNMHAEIVSGGRFTDVLSPQSLLSCSPNELECGGQGGCKGATAEVAYDWLKSMGTSGGVRTIGQQPYTATDQKCSSPGQSLRGADPAAVSITGWKKIKDNDAEALMNTLVTVGPLATSIAASGLHGYSSGVVDGCQDNIINHAVVLTGYGSDPEYDMNYWKVRNSWGKNWGEDGFFKLKRAAAGQEEPCGWDNKPEEGVVCKDKVHGKYPKRQWVCGECGFLVDSAYPVGTHVPPALLEANAIPAERGADEMDVVAETAEDNTWCKTQCQRFGMKQLSDKFDGADFGRDPITCSDKCDEYMPGASAAVA